MNFLCQKKIDSKCIHIFSDSNNILVGSFARICLVNLIANKLPALIVKGNISSEKMLFQKGFLKIEFYTNSDNIDNYKMTNRNLARIDQGYYLNYDAVKEFVDSIVEVDYESVTNDLLSGL